MMNKNLPAFLHHMLIEADFPEDFIKTLLRKSCEASLVAEISACKWEKTSRTLTTPADEKHEKKLKAFEGATWFKDEFGFLNKKVKPLTKRPPEDLFNLDSSASVKTIHDRHQHSSILKTKPSTPVAPSKEGNGEKEIDLTCEDTDRDSASHNTSSSSSRDDDASSDGSRSESSNKDDVEEESATNGG